MKVRARGGARVVSVELTPEMQRLVLDQRLGFVATVTPDGRPNLSPKGTTVVLDDRHLMFADIASPGTVDALSARLFTRYPVRPGGDTSTS